MRPAIAAQRPPARGPPRHVRLPRPCPRPRRRRCLAPGNRSSCRRARWRRCPCTSGRRPGPADAVHGGHARRRRDGGEPRLTHPSTRFMSAYVFDRDRWLPDGSIGKNVPCAPSRHRRRPTRSPRRHGATAASARASTGARRARRAQTRGATARTSRPPARPPTRARPSDRHRRETRRRPKRPACRCGCRPGGTSPAHDGAAALSGRAGDAALIVVGVGERPHARVRHQRARDRP